MYALESLHYRLTEQLTHRLVHSFCGNVACGGGNNTNLPIIYRRCPAWLTGLCSLRGRRIGVDFHHLVGGDKNEIYYRPHRLGRNSERVGAWPKSPSRFSSMESSFTMPRRLAPSP